MFIDLFSGPRYLPPGLNMNIKLHKNSDSFVCISANGTYKVKIVDLRLYMNMVSLDNSKTAHHLEILEKGGTLYEPFKSTNTCKQSDNIVTTNENMNKQTLLCNCIRISDCITGVGF